MCCYYLIPQYLCTGLHSKSKYSSTLQGAIGEITMTTVDKIVSTLHIKTPPHLSNTITSAVQCIAAKAINVQPNANYQYVSTHYILNMLIIPLLLFVFVAALSLCICSP